MTERSAQSHFNVHPPTPLPSGVTRDMEENEVTQILTITVNTPVVWLLLVDH